tara:strand:- start:7336 stop:8391 length:1056 start_codon:yes stop_codon:yes gene_type:complete
MFSFNKKQHNIIYSEIKNALQFWCVRIFGPLYNRISKSDVAFMLVEHPVILPFLINVKLHLGITIHFVKPGSDLSNYSRVIIPNGLWPSVKNATSQIPENKRVYCEIGFLPQTKNIYFDRLGVHGHSALRHAALLPLTVQQKNHLEEFRLDFGKTEFVRVKWDSMDITHTKNPIKTQLFDFEFLFVPLQLESDTAFELCEFSSNQEIILFIQKSFPNDTIVFKVHPQDKNDHYTVDPTNILLPNTNQELRALICQCKAVVASNSTVILEALLLQKKCATFGIGLTTNHQVTLECHEDLTRLPALACWEPDWDTVDRFLVLVLEKQIRVNFYESQSETKKLLKIFSDYGVMC